MLETSGHKHSHSHSHSQYVVLFPFPQRPTVVTRASLSFTLYIQCLSCFHMHFTAHMRCGLDNLGHRRLERNTAKTREGEILSIIHWLSYRCRSIPQVTTPHAEMVTPLAAETSVHVTWARHVARSDGIRYAHKIVVRKHRGTIPPDIQKRRSGNFNISWPGPRYILTVSFWNYRCFE